VPLREIDVALPDGRTVHAYDSGGSPDALAVCWHHGTPNIGAPPSPLLDRGVRWFSADRAGYGGSTPLPGRTVGSVATDVEAVADALGIERFALMGHSGGSPHALACAALLADRVVATVAISGLAPRDAEGLDWNAGMAAAGVASLHAAGRGRVAREALEEAGEELDFGFTPEDEEALGSRWAWFLDVVRPAIAAGPAAAIDDDLAVVAPWDFDPAHVSSPVLVVHGDADRVVPASHGQWLAGRIPGAELWVRAGDGHITVMDAAADALDWLEDHRVTARR
jgi:pimeloyl-ACP methyl ester carboxylesterase